MKELITTVVILAGLTGTANAQSVPGMPALTKPVSAPQEVPAGSVTTNGGALALSAPKKPLPKPTASAGSGTGVTQQMVDRSKKPEPVPQALAAAAIEQPSWTDTGSDFGTDLAEEVGYQRHQLGPGRASSPGELTLRPGRNEMVQVARGQLNRFITPFARPDVKHTSETTTFKVEGQIVYIATASTSPVSVFIEDKGNPVNAMSLTLVPREIPAVSVALRMDEYIAPPPVTASEPTEMRADGGDDFVAMLRETFRSIATGEIPSGFGMKRLRGYSDLMPECVMPGLQAQPAQEIANGSIIVVVSKVTNRTRIPQTVDESSCASDAVIAVAAWPNVDLMPGQSTELYVALRRNVAPASNARPSVL